MKTGDRQQAIGNSKKLKLVSYALFSILLALCIPAEAQQSAKVPRIGYLSTVSPSVNAARIKALRQSRRELGYVEGKNIVIEWRYAEAKLDRLRSLAAELVRLKVDVIITAAPPPTRVANRATATIPIVMAFDDDPVGNGFVASLARPGGNITGLATFRPETSGKRLELLREIVHKLSRVAVLGTSTMPGALRHARQPARGCDRFLLASRARLACDKRAGLEGETFAVFAEYFAIFGLSLTPSLGFRILAHRRPNQRRAASASR